MKFALTFLLLLSLASSLRAGDETARHRELYNQINKDAPSLAKVSATVMTDDGNVRLTGWIGDGEVRKILAESGAEVTEYYLDNEKPAFVFLVTTHDNPARKTEERIYFDADGPIFRWLNTDKDAPIMHAEDYAAFGELLMANAARFSAALREKQGAPASASGTRAVEGQFLGVEEGDYAHWKMRTASGDDVSFFLLRPDAALERVLADPQEYEGRRCRATIKQSTEDIPEAGGSMEIEQIVGVEWL